MYPESPLSDADDGVEERFAALFRKFASPTGDAVGAAEGAFLLGRLRPPAGARLLCCPRSTMLFGWALTSAGCSVHLADDPTSRSLLFDGAVWSVQALTNAGAANPAVSSLLASAVRAGGRLILTAGPNLDREAADPSRGPALLATRGFAFAGETLSPDSRRLALWLRAADSAAS